MEIIRSAASVRIHNLSHRYPSGLQSVSDVNFDILQGEFISLVGPSGCGKSTLLRILAGLLKPSSGELVVGPFGDLLESTGQTCAFVFQNPTLLPWRSVRENLLLPLELLGVAKRERLQRAEELLELVGLSEFAKAWPAQLSGGMRMRVSIARALAVRPKLLLLDEPFAALDEFTRNKLQEDLLDLRKIHAFTTVLVTHNVAESVFMADRVLCMKARPGRIVAQVAVPFGIERDGELRTSAELAHYCRQVTHALREAGA